MKMRKQRILTVTVVAMVALLLVGGLAVAGESSAIVPFEATRARVGPPNPGPQQIVGCNIKRAEQIALWRVDSLEVLVAGDWINPDTKVNREIVEYSDDDGGPYDCIPSDPPDPDEVSLVLGIGIVHGPFELVPFAYAGCGVWEGVWKVWFQPDGSRIIAATAKGVGVLEGLTLKVFNKIPFEGEPAFNGFIVYPPSVVLPLECPPN